MASKHSDISLAPHQNIVEERNENKKFTTRVTKLSALACNDVASSSFNIDVAAKESQNFIQALGAKGGLQEMVAAQILSIHRLQQLTMSMLASGDKVNIEVKQYFTNTAIKLANVFVQQANLLSRLQGDGVQKIVVERVDVHSGGQAIVGNVNGGSVKK
jgi:hypothetical protein